MARPDDRVVVEFDQYTSEFRDNAASIAKGLRDRCPVAFTESSGGFWVFSTREAILKVAQDPKTYSSRHVTEADGTRLAGIAIPEEDFVIGMAEDDPPEWSLYRRVVGPLLTPRAVKRLEPYMHRFVAEKIDDVIESGTVDFVADIINPVPALVTMVIVGLPLERAEEFEAAVHSVDAAGGGAANHDEAMAGFIKLVEGLEDVVNEKRQKPVDLTLLSQLVHCADGNGHPLSEEKILSVAIGVLLGGIGTTTSLLAHALHHLDREEDDRQFLLTDLSRLQLGVEELLRAYAPVPGLGRTVTRDHNVGGQTLRRGERVWLFYASANRDEEVFESPDEVRLGRVPNPHA